MIAFMAVPSGRHISDGATFRVRTVKTDEQEHLFRAAEGYEKLPVEIVEASVLF